MTAEAFLASVPLFAALAADHLRSIAAAGRTKTVATGETVFREGDASDGLYIVLSGKVRIYKHATTATRSICTPGPRASISANSR